MNIFYINNMTITNFCGTVSGSNEMSYTGTTLHFSYPATILEELVKIKDMFENWGITGLKINIGFMEMEWQPKPEEQQAAWELYIELITRAATQSLGMDEGDEETALRSIGSLFQATRELLKQKGRKAEVFSRIAVVMLNQKVRPFTSKWHKQISADQLKNPEGKAAFRQELEQTQEVLRRYAAMLANMAGVEDFQALDQEPLQKL